MKDIAGKKVLVRVDFNVPIQNGRVVDDFKIRKALPTIEFLRKQGAKVILISHIGREKDETLQPVAEHLKKFLGIIFIPRVLGDEVTKAVNKMNDGDVILLENLRSHEGEVKNDESFGRGLASLGGVYVNDAFAVCHREHASIMTIPKFLPSYTGLQLEAEINNLDKVLTNPRHPFLFILGGAKFETKIPLIEKFLEIADFVFIGGALANNFFKEQGLDVGKSVVDLKDFGLENVLKSEKLILPVDVIVTPPRDGGVKRPREVESNEMIVDVGPESLRNLQEYIDKSEFILWNGPLGWYEKGFDDSTKKLTEMLAESKAETIVGGGDTVALISSLGLEEKFSFVSTGGGAMLEFLQKGTLPGIDALGDSPYSQ